MLQKIFIIGLFLCCIFAFSFFTKKTPTPSENVKIFYLQQARQFETEIIQLQKIIASGNEKKLQQQFLKIRLAYKQIETIAEYYFNYYAVKLNGPPILFFEEDEPDRGQQQPAGMQVIEGMVFPHYNAANKKELQTVTEQLLQDTKYMQATNESFTFNDEYIFDAVTEELFRITAMGITGFDSQIAVNALPECGAALSGVEKILQLYQQNIQQSTGNNYNQLQTLLANAQIYIKQNTGFISFNRMQFITAYLNPITKIIGDYKTAKQFGENKSAMFYSTVKKNNTLFAQNIFDVNKYLDDNTTSAEKIELGKKLFFDTQLSKDNKRSCASCHNPAKTFTDGLATSTAIDGHTALLRNAPTLWNAALQRNLFLDNRSSSLEDQVMQVLNNASEMHGSAQKAAEKIIAQKDYTGIYAKAYPAATTDNAAQNICNAIACYERTLIALNSKFDRHMRGQALLNDNETKGFNLFMGKAKCGTCHFMPLFSGAKPPRYYYTETEVIGVPDKNKKINARLDEDEGRFIATGVPVHKYAFKTSTLRNIVLTAPYMHNGVFKTLEEVMNFYNNGGGKGLKIAPPNQTLPFEKLNLSKKEQQNIITFLNTLTDTVQTKSISLH
jgi:cytochrome c peroxidase